MSDPKVTKGQRVYQVIDLSKEFGVNFGKQNDLKLKLAQALIDKMKERIGDGLDYHLNPMHKYSKEYKESPEYIAARKTGTVNMTLSGDMMGSIDVIKEQGNKVTIGFNQREQELKAHRHMTGFHVPVREFFGVNDNEIEEVKKEFSSELSSLKDKGLSSDESTVGKFLTLEQLRSELARIENGFSGKAVDIILENIVESATAALIEEL